jgi:hypothetical protein
MTGQLGKPLADHVHRDEVTGFVGALEDITGQRLGQLLSGHGLTVEQHHGDNTAIHR